MTGKPINDSSKEQHEGLFYRANDRSSSRRGLLGTIRSKVLLALAGSAFMPVRWRVRLHRARGVHFDDPDTVFLGEGVVLEPLYPHRVSIGANVMITRESIIYAHFYDPSFAEHTMRLGNVRIEPNVFVGARSLVVNGVTLGRGAVVGAQSVVTQDVPENTISAGAPARPIKARGERHLGGSS